MYFQEHVEESLKLFGKPYAEVHRWLDEYAGKPPYGMRHRKMRHHLAGLKQVEEIFGKDAVPAARQHIISDLKTEGWKETDPFPADEKHYVKMGLF